MTPDAPRPVPGRRAARWAARVGLAVLVPAAGLSALADGRVPTEERRSVVAPPLDGTPEHALLSDQAFDLARIDPVSVAARSGAAGLGAGLVTFVVVRRHLA